MQLANLVDQGTGYFTPAELAALAYTDEMTIRPRGIADLTFDNLRRHWTDPQIIEITAVAALFSAFNRINNALQVEPTLYPPSTVKKDTVRRDLRKPEDRTVPLKPT